MSKIFKSVLLLLLAGLANAQNSAPNPYETIEGWAELPDGRVWGATSAIYPANDGKHIWVAERCGTNLCVGSDVDPVLLYDQEGNVVKSFGAGMITWPHGMFVDVDDNVWIADAVGYAPVPEGIGHTIMKFSPDGELLMRLGKEGVAGDGTDVFNKPSDMLVARGVQPAKKTANSAIRMRLLWTHKGGYSSAIVATVACRFSHRMVSTSRHGRSSAVQVGCSLTRTTSCIRLIPNQMLVAIPGGNVASELAVRKTDSSPRSSRIPSLIRIIPARAPPKA
jgi:hypothetical protein